MDIFLAASSIFLLRLLDQTLGTLRTLYVNKGKPSFGAVLGFVESAIWVVAISQVIRDLDSPFLVFGYALGFAALTPNFLAKVIVRSEQGLLSLKVS